MFKQALKGGSRKAIKISVAMAISIYPCSKFIAILIVFGVVIAPYRFPTLLLFSVDIDSTLPP
ncbi:MAG: hypothetical protein AAFO02_26120 [Bacteroidota bacterium]